jgi:ribosomal protein L16 Arg81 hydroxylase
MDLQALLGDVPVRKFVADYYYRLPYAAPAAVPAARQLADWESLTTILAAELPDVLVCRRNERFGGEVPRSAAAARELVGQGYTLLVRHAERHDPRLAELAANFERDFASTVNVHLYCTPGGEHGFGWHYDAEEVFIVQSSGSKDYALRKNTVNPWPLIETLPADMQYEREIMPLWRCRLAAGQWLYIPSGYWHQAAVPPLGEPAISLAIGVEPRAAIEVLDWLRPRLLESLQWRERLPVSGAAAALSTEELRAECRRRLDALAADLARRFSDPRLVDAFLDRSR